MKTFESQLLELLREYRYESNKNWAKLVQSGVARGFHDEEELPGFDFKDFYVWLYKRVENRDAKRDKLFSICEKYSQSGFLDNVRDNKEEFFKSILEL